jgi:RNA polymerase sigma-70 factor (ECF subfamily)
MTPAIDLTGIDLDTQLMIAAQADDHTSFGILLERNRHHVVNYLSRMVANHAVAEDLAQEVFIRVYRSRRSYAPTAKFSTWLYRISTNVALNYFRDEKRTQREVSLDAEGSPLRQSASDRSPLIEARLVQEVVNEQIRRAVRALPPKQRAAVLMHKYDEMDYSRIAEVLGCTPAAVKALMFRAYETLRMKLGSLQNKP